MSLWTWKKSGWVNATLAISLILAVITSISSTGIRSGFKALTPNFSFHGGLYPEVGLFNFLLLCAGMFGFVSVTLRYSYIMDQVQVMPTSINYLNKASASTGIVSFLGLLLTASFSVPLLETVSSFQSTGPYLFIGFGVIFTILQTVLTYTSSRFSVIFILRLCLSVILLCCFISSIVFVEKSKVESSSIENDTFYSKDNTAIKFTQNYHAEILRTQKEMSLLIACILEWISVIIYALFYLSFFQEFQTISAYIIMRPFITTPSNDFRSSSLTVNERV